MPSQRFNSMVRPMCRLDSGDYIPAAVAEAVCAKSPGKPFANARAAYEDYVNLRYLRPVIVVPVFIFGFVLVLYLLGKLFAAGVGGFIESVARRLPVVRSVYASVKKVTDFAFVESEVEFKRVVAIEFPRKGIWTVGLVTGEGMLDIAGAAHEPCVTVAVPGSPVPFTGNVVTVPKSAAHDLNITIDEALQFFISCGVVVPSRLEKRRARAKPADGSASQRVPQKASFRKAERAQITILRTSANPHRHTSQSTGPLAGPMGGGSTRCPRARGGTRCRSPLGETSTATARSATLAQPASSPKNCNELYSTGGSTSPFTA